MSVQRSLISERAMWFERLQGSPVGPSGEKMKMSVERWWNGTETVSVCAKLCQCVPNCDNVCQLMLYTE
jgi:hypothetical protein